MLNTTGLLYLSARAVSAAGNLFAVAIFSRMAGPAEFGHYVFIFAWSLIVYGFGAQWIRFAYFGVYHLDRFGEYIASLARLLAAGIAVVAVVLVAIGCFGLFEPRFLVAVFALVCGIAVYEAAFEVARTLLNARGASLSMILRTVLMVEFGSATLYLGGGALGLALAIALAHLIAAAPSLATFSQVRWSHSSRAAALHIVSDGWPLLLSFGVTAVGQSIDRLLLAHYLGLATLGSYGVVADVLRQSFTVLGEAIILSLVTVAKTQANRGDVDGANQTLQKAFNACLAAATFGAAFFIVFGDAVLRVVLQLRRADARSHSDLHHRLCIYDHAQFLLCASDLFHQCQLSRAHRGAVVSRGFHGFVGRHGPALRPARRSPGPDGGLHLLLRHLHAAGPALVPHADRSHRARRHADARRFVCIRRTCRRRIGHRADAGPLCRCRDLRGLRRLCDPSFRLAQLTVSDVIPESATVL
jgi:hypothetical protein